MIFKCCERFGQGVDWFYKQDKQMQIDYLAYCQIRDLEEAHVRLATMSAGVAHGF